MAQVELKLFATLTQYLPADARGHTVRVELNEGSTIYALMAQFNIPASKAHLVVLNGLFVPLSERDTHKLQEGDVVALWPPVAGG